MSDATALGQVFGDLIGAAMVTLAAVQLAVFVGVGLWYVLVTWLTGGGDSDANR